MTTGPHSESDRPADAEPDSAKRTPAHACAEVSAALAALARSAVLKDASRVLIAYSGGLDSTVLLHAAVQALGAPRCCAVYIHHGLSARADAWQTHCEQVAHALGCTLVTRRVQLA